MTKEPMFIKDYFMRSQEAIKTWRQIYLLPWGFMEITTRETFSSVSTLNKLTNSKFQKLFQLQTSQPSSSIIVSQNKEPQSQNDSNCWSLKRRLDLTGPKGYCFIIVVMFMLICISLSLPLHLMTDLASTRSPRGNVHGLGSDPLDGSAWPCRWRVYVSAWCVHVSVSSRPHSR